MMVTFISQCEKKALKKTRRVLDAFANRIGDNTWQTVITKEGLQAVHKLLKKTASKSTAVSCHWIRSRSRSDLLWVVGKRHEFNDMGYVPVNYTSKEVIMDKTTIETKNIYANTKGQTLSEHLFAVGFLAFSLIKKIGIENPRLAQSAFVAGILHDIGKIDPQFQQWLLKKLGKFSEDLKEDAPLPDDGFHIDNSVKGHTKFSFEKHPRHHEISWLMSVSLLHDDTLNSSQLSQIYHGIYWHHTRPFRKENQNFFNKPEGIYKLLKKSLDAKKNDSFFETVNKVLKDVQTITAKFDETGNLKSMLPKWASQFNLSNQNLPEYKSYSDISDELDEFKSDVRVNGLNNIIRTVVISADRIVSAMSADDLTEYLLDGTLERALDDITLEDNTLIAEMERCIQGFDNKYPNSKRNQTQTKAATEIAKLKEIAEFDEAANIGVLQGPAGCGKTKITLEWAAKTKAKKIIWVCPRVQVCLGLVHDLTQAEYLPNSNIEIFTGEFKKTLTDGINLEDAPDTPDDEYFKGDIVITTIDQVINNIISHNKVTAMVDFMQSHVVFDEFHELIPMPAFNLLFAELLEAKKLLKHHANTLLVSATPHDYFITEFLKIDKNDIIRVPSFNQSRYRIEFQTYDEKEVTSPLITQHHDNGLKTFVITNTAQDAQLGFLKQQNSENNILLHSKYTKSDKAKWFDEVFQCFKQNGNSQYDVLRSGPIVQASLNISCDRMFTELTNAENWLQRLGRLDRFGVNDTDNIYTTVMPESCTTGKQSNNTAKFLNRLFSWRSTVAWLDYLQNNLNTDEKGTIQLNDLYQLYHSFYNDSSCQQMIDEDLKLALRKSVETINNKVIDPISFPPKSKRKDGVAKISKNSLRGDNRFVQMAVCEVDEDLNIKFTDEYAYSEDTNHAIETVSLTESTERIRGYGDSSKDLLAFMQSKHHNIKKEAKKAYKDFLLLTEARSPEHPIYLSYTPVDLEPIGGERERHKYAIYYIHSKKQPVGAMSIDKLTTPTSVED